MIRRRGKFARTLLMIGSAAPTIADGARGSWRHQKWLVPLIVFLCITGLILVGINAEITLFFALLQILGVRVSARVQEYTSLLKTLAFALLIAVCFVFADPSPHATTMPRTGPLSTS